MLAENVERISSRVEGFDVLIVCTSSEAQAAYWQRRLEAGAGTISPAKTKILCVFEDWAPCGAGNGLGTLYAWRKASAKAAAEGLTFGASRSSLPEALAAGAISAAIYHTAGKGTRLAPLPGAENNNKPGVKLPACVKLADGSKAPITILEAVVRQTGAYAKCRKGRLSVFWGDQVFVPSAPVEYKPTHLADILCTLGPMPSAEEWKARGLHKYGLIAVNASGDAAQVEKVTHDVATRLLSSLGQVTQVGTSLGSFSVSSALLDALMEEFAKELDAKAATLDTDPHFWMPMTLEQGAYVELMKTKDTNKATATAHWKRVRAMLAKLEASSAQDGRRGVFTAVDVGQSALWWDYGQVKLYIENNAKLKADGAEADAMRRFLGVARGGANGNALVSCLSGLGCFQSLARRNANGKALAVDPVSCLSGCAVKAGEVKSSVLAGVTAATVTADGAILVNVTARSIRAAPGSVAYNVVDDSAEGIVLQAGEIYTDIFQEDGSKVRQTSDVSIDGKDAWKKAVRGNKYSFGEVYEQNVATDISKVEEIAKAAHAKVAATL
eukprot:TRINITY_DN6870_c0_g1_i1.p1 TRINITY_DN6870_c0_g1~~TRINITY_DN6870_c0_g1_i1.p1  ORF type:complete len:554 (-),score=143.79 TRINITY_DN6870_c0_g1_i1:171-1832(-)